MEFRFDALVRGIDLVVVARLEVDLGFGKHRFQVLLFVGIECVTVFADGLLRLVDHRVEVVLLLDAFASRLICGRVSLGVGHHAIDLVVRKTTGVFDANGLLVVRRLVERRNREDPVCIDVEGHFDLWHAARRRRQTVENEASNFTIVRRHVPLALQHADFHLRLGVAGRREYLLRSARDRGVSLDQLRHHGALRLNSQ